MMEEKKKKISVLVIDDEPMLLDVMKEFLELRGYEVFEATDGKSAVEIFKRLRPKIVILDLRLPGIDGLRVRAILKEIKKDVKIIIISGHIQEEFDQSEDIFLKKPFNLDELMDALKKVEAV